MTSNGVIALILRFSPTSIALQADYVTTVVKDRPIMSVNIVSQMQSSIFGQNQRTLQRAVSAIAEHFVNIAVALWPVRTKTILACVDCGVLACVLVGLAGERVQRCG